MSEEIIIDGGRYRPGTGPHRDKLFTYDGIEWIKSNKLMSEYIKALDNLNPHDIDEYKGKFGHYCNLCGCSAVKGYKNGVMVFDPDLCIAHAPAINSQDTKSGDKS